MSRLTAVPTPLLPSLKNDPKLRKAVVAARETALNTVIACDDALGELSLHAQFNSDGDVVRVSTSLAAVSANSALSQHLCTAVRTIFQNALSSGFRSIIDNPVIGETDKVHFVSTLVEQIQARHTPKDLPSIDGVLMNNGTAKRRRPLRKLCLRELCEIVRIYANAGNQRCDLITHALISSSI